MITQLYHHFHPLPAPEPESLTHNQQVQLVDMSYRMYMALREYVYAHGIHCERDKYSEIIGKEIYKCSACKELRAVMDEA